jgi:putative transposase
MPRRLRLAAGALAYHVLNRRVGRLQLLEKPADYAAFENILAEAHAQAARLYTRTVPLPISR